MLFRPEEIHLASRRPAGDFSRQKLGEGDVHVADRRRWVHVQNLFISHADEDRLSTIQTMGVDADLSAGKEPAHG